MTMNPGFGHPMWSQKLCGYAPGHSMQFDGDNYSWPSTDFGRVWCSCGICSLWPMPRDSVEQFVADHLADVAAESDA